MQNDELTIELEEQQLLWDYLKKADKPIVLYGTGDGADKILAVMEQYELTPACFTRSEVFGRFEKNPTFRNYKVLPFDEIERKYSDFIVLICFGSDSPEVLEQLYNISERYEVFAPDVPVTGWGISFKDLIYDFDYIERNKDKIEKTRKLLADEKSREVFDGWLAYRVSGNPHILEKIATPRKDILSLLKLKDNEFFIDAGAFKGDTVEEFLQLVGQKSEMVEPKFKKIIAIEPDIRNYTVLRRKFYAYGKGIFIPVNAAAWSEDKKITFTAKTGRAGTVRHDVLCVSHRKQVEIEGVKIDTLCKINAGQPTLDEKPTLIKIDVEGAEAEVIKGAKSVITKYRPKMIVSLYHRAEDMFELPLLIYSLCPRYRFYLRKTRCLPGWEFELILI